MEELLELCVELGLAMLEMAVESKSTTAIVLVLTLISIGIFSIFYFQ